MLEPYQELEEQFKAWSGCNDVVVCSSGSAALHLSLEVLQLPLGSYVAACDYTMIAVPRAITLAGHIPIFIDCMPDSLLISNDGLSTTLRYHFDVSAIIIVHTYGRRFDLTRMFATCPLKNTFVIEDLAEAHGIKPHPMSDVAVWSFYKNKIIYGEEGGAIGFKNPVHAKLARQLRSLGFTDAHDFIHVPRGHNYRMSNLHAKPILESLNYFPTNISIRREFEKVYNKFCPIEWMLPQRDSPWVYDIRIPGMKYQIQSKVIRTLNAAGIQARHGFKSMSFQQEYESYVRNEDVPNSCKASFEVIYLPLSPCLGVTEVDYAETAFDIIKSVLY